MHLCAIGAQMDEDLAHRMTALEPRPERGMDGRVVAAGAHRRELAPDQIAGAQAGDLLVALVGEFNQAVLVADQHAVGGGV
ncbi:hypothetical protein D3C86_1909310 [compost metagenome]